MSINVEIEIHEFSQHCEQIFTGLRLLHLNKEINLSYKNPKIIAQESPPPMLSRNRSQITIILNGTIKVHYDLDDSPVINNSALSECDLYFKRSYITEFCNSSKIRPLGLNFPIRANGYLIDSIVRQFHSMGNVKKNNVVTNNLFEKGWRNIPHISKFDNNDIVESYPKILFFTRVWDLESAKTREQKNERHIMNTLRVECISLLRKEFGDIFLGGLEPNQYALSNYREFVSWNSSLTSKSLFLDSVSKHSICITSSGLHGSIGWKFAEYVAMGRSIITEKFPHTLFGNIEEKDNFLSYFCPNTCVEKVYELLNNDTLLINQQRNNKKYFENYLHPEKLARRTLEESKIFI